MSEAQAIFLRVEQWLRNTPNKYAHELADEFARALASGLAPREGEVWRAQVISLLEAMRDNDPDDSVADAATCWMLWKYEINKLLAPPSGGRDER